MTVTAGTTWRDVAARVGREVAGPSADTVDREARFPAETFAALREAGMLSALVPQARGGGGASFAEAGRAVEELGRWCSSSALILAMHHIQVACLVRHGRTPELEALLDRVVAEQLLLASATTEIGIGGDVRTSSCHVEAAAGRYLLHKNAPVISYGAQADVVMTTARRDVEAPPSDQVLVACLAGDGLVLEQTSTWDTLGFRGTCSPGYLLTASGPEGLVLPEPYADISARTMLPLAHVLWASTWLGMATAAVDAARRFVREAARRTPGTAPPGALHLVGLTGDLQALADLVHGAAARYDALSDDADALTAVGFGIAMNNLKITASTTVADLVTRALLILGIGGYRQEGRHSIARLVRDAHGAALMVNNDRIALNTAQLLLVHRDEGGA